MARKSAPRVFGIVRQSRTDVNSVSPGEQRARIVEACERDGMSLVEVAEELDVSGGTPLAKRRGLLRAVEQVEAGAVDVIAVAYFDRLVRSLAVQHEVVERVERAGGRILALDIGEVSNGTASQWLSSSVLGMVAEYARRSGRERVRESQIIAVADGRAPFPLPVGLRRNATTRRMEPDPETAPIVAECFRRRLDGASLNELRDWMREQGIKISANKVQRLLSSRLLLGQIHFGDIGTNLDVCEPVVEPAIWRRVQDLVIPRGRKAKSERLLARQEVLRCGHCGSRLVVSSRTQPSGKKTPVYCCPFNNDCTSRVQINAEIVERFAEDETKRLLSAMSVSGSASVADELDAARARKAAADLDLDNAIEAFDGLNVAAAKSKLSKLQKVADDAAADLEDIERAAAPMQLVSVGEWHLMTLDERRRLIRLMLASIEVRRGPRGADPLSRVTPVPRESLG